MAPGVYHESHYGKGSYKVGKWYCDCGELAGLITSGRDNEHKGKEYWRCPRPKEKCTFYLWLEHEAEAKEHHKAAECPMPQTPTKADIRSYLERTPSTTLNRKRAAKDSTNSEIDEDTYDYSPAESAAKATRRSIFSTPGQQPTRPKSDATSLPTPDSRPYTGKRRASRLNLLQPLDASPTPVRSRDASLKPDEDTNTFTSVLELLRDDGFEPDRSAREMLRYLITSKVFRDT